ncbi:MAG: hypothetical protein EOP04_04190 [Proteobacteria bacterium]|nr:MAG: hypothetical protein EOP04_04190 [Pseudomonadota bacterium]
MQNEQSNEIFVKAVVGSKSTWDASAVALMIAKDICPIEKVAFIDSVGHGPKLSSYQKLKGFTTIVPQSEGEFASPKEWVESLRIAIEIGSSLVVMNTVSDEWQWCLSEIERLGGNARSYKLITPKHDRFVRAITKTKVHIIMVARRKEKIDLKSAQGSKTEVTSLGIRSIQRPGFEEEMDIIIGLGADLKPTIEQDNSRCFQRGQTPTLAEVGVKLKNWIDKSGIDGKR